jgi:uroporphyrinogen-III synthase
MEQSSRLMSPESANRSGWDLKGITVLVTRPEHQAEHLCEIIEAHGGRAQRLPVLEIRALSDTDALDRLCERLGDFDVAVFISVNAVRMGLQHIRALRAWPAGVKIATVGASSAQALNDFGLTVDYTPQHEFSSEALLALGPLQDMTGRKVVIFRGEGGRPLLGDTLRERGAEVTYAEVYRRARPQMEPRALMRYWADGLVDVITVASNESLENLCAMAGEAGRPLLRRIPLVVVSWRTAELARRLGFDVEPVVAQNASDEAVLAALLRWRRAAATGR